jgi:hypothetical protein
MFFINKLLNRPVTLKMVTYRKEHLEESKPQKSSKYFPDWWRNLPLENETGDIGWSSTMKRCVGMTNQYQKGFIFPLWTDISINMDKKGSTGAIWQAADMDTRLENHSQQQRGNYLKELDYLHLKLINPWLIFCEEDIEFLMVQPTWNFDRPEEIIIPTGTLDFKYQHGAHINMFFKREEFAKKIRLEHGSVLVQLMPLTDRPLKLEYSVVDPLEYAKIYPNPTKFSNRYKTRKNAAKKCPFH